MIEVLKLLQINMEKDSIQQTRGLTVVASSMLFTMFIANNSDT